MLSGGLMKEVESFLHHAGIPVQDGLKMLKADAAADAVVLTAQGLEGTGRDVIIKISKEKGIFSNHPHLKEEWVSEGVQKMFPSALNNGETVMVRIEPRLLPVDKAIAALPPEMQQEATKKFNDAMYAKAKSKGLIARDVKPNNFGIPLDASAQNIEDIVAHAKIMDLDAIAIPTAQARAQMANPGVEYKAEAHTAPATHIDHILEGETKAADGPGWSARMQKPAPQAAVTEKPTAAPTLGDKYAALRARMESLGIKQTEGSGSLPGHK
jgi:hypothetical protein